MYLDKQAEFSDAQAVTASAISTNVVDLFAGTASGAVNNTLRDIGTGEDVYLVVSVDVAATAAGAATVTVTLESDSTADLATSATVHASSKAFALAEMTAGARLMAIKLPAGSYERYLGVRFTVATGPLTAGAFSAFLTTDAQAYRAYARNYTA